MVDHVYLAPEDDFSDAECPLCEEAFDRDEWEYDWGGDSRGGSAWYQCPECDTQSVTVVV